MNSARVHHCADTYGRILLLLAVFALLATLTTGECFSQIVCNRTYTLNADFDQGILVNVNHDVVTDQLQLNTTTTPFPFVNIACSNRGTAVRIDVNTGAVLGEYLTSPDGMGRNPSRTTVDKFGNVWVANRDEQGISGGQPKGSVTRIALVIGGTRCNADGTPNPAGQYLKPPFLYNTAVDRHGAAVGTPPDGLIKTSLGLGNILAWTNAGGANTDGGVSLAEDELIINYTRVAGTNTRTVAVDANNDLWTGGLGDFDHEKLSGVTGLPIPGTQFNLGCGGYGGLVDGNGVLWSSRGASSLLRFVPNNTPPPAGTGACIGYPDGYGLGIDPVTGHIWHTYLNGNIVVELDAAGNLLHTYGHGSYYAQGLAVDASGNVWVAHSLLEPSTTVGHLRTDGTFVGNVSLPGGSGPTGVAVDANGKIWVANYSSHNAMRIDPNAGPTGGGGFPVGAVDLTVDLNAAGGTPASPYNYSDMTGFVAIGSTAPSGTWTVIHDGGVSGRDWGSVCWTSSIPAGTSIDVEVRAADLVTDLPLRTFVPVMNCVSFCGTGLTGRYIEVRTSLSRQAGTNASPVLYDLTVECCDVNCPLSQGYWKNHGDDWPEHALPMLLGTTNTYTKGMLMTLLRRAPAAGGKADASVILAHQLIAAKLNLANGAPAVSEVVQAISTADSAIGSGTIPMYVRTNTSLGRLMTSLAGILDNYNNNMLTPNCGPPESASLRKEPAQQQSPTDYSLGANYPNPFNPDTRITYSLPENVHARLVVYDAVGREVKVLVDRVHAAGHYEVAWDGTNKNGAPVTSGLYFYRLTAGSFSQMRKMALLR